MQTFNIPQDFSLRKSIENLFEADPERKGIVEYNTFLLKPVIEKMKNWSIPVAKAFTRTVQATHEAGEVEILVKIFDQLNKEIPKDQELDNVIHYFHELVYNPAMEAEMEYELEIEEMERTRSKPKKKKK